MDFWREVFVPVVSATVGTAAGATVAFLSERMKRQREMEDAHVTATNTALFVLFQIVNDLSVYRQNFIEPCRSDPERWYNLPPTRLPEPPKFDAATLSYLLEIPGDAPTLPMAVYVGIGKYQSIFGAAAERYRIHMQEVQPALEVARRTVPGQLSIKQLVDTVLGGSRVTDIMQILTDDLIDITDDALDYIPKHAEWLRNVAMSKYPNRQIPQGIVGD